MTHRCSVNITACISTVLRHLYSGESWKDLKRKSDMTSLVVLNVNYGRRVENGSGDKVKAEN